MKKNKNRSVAHFIVGIPAACVNLFRSLLTLLRFIVLLGFVFINFVLNYNGHSVKTMPGERKRTGFINRVFARLYTSAIRLFDTNKSKEIKASDLMMLAFKNLSAKRTRTYVTIGGMAIGFAAIILLLSAGYGFERLVVSQIADLNEMKQVDVVISSNSPLVFSSDAIDGISEIRNVEMVIPIVTTVSKVTYNNAISDVISIAVPSDYFEERSIHPLEGELFVDEFKTLHSELPQSDAADVAGVATSIMNIKSFGDQISKISYSIHPMVWVAVYSSPDLGSSIIGYTKRQPGSQEAVEVWGAAYSGSDSTAVDIQGSMFSRWVEDEFLLWNRGSCLLVHPDCVDGEYSVKRDSISQELVHGYITEDNVTLSRFDVIKVEDTSVSSLEFVGDINFRLDPSRTLDLYWDANESAGSVPLVAPQEEASFPGEVLYGQCSETESGSCFMDEQGVLHGLWVRVTLGVWGQQECDPVCDEYSLIPDEINTKSYELSGYVKFSRIISSDGFSAQTGDEVLGAETEGGEEIDESDSFVDINEISGSDDTIDWAAITSGLGLESEVETEVKAFPAKAQKKALVNTAMLTLLGMKASDAVGESFSAKLIYDSSLFDKSNTVFESEEVDMMIEGIVEESNTPAYYLPLNDVLVDGLNNVSSLKVVAREKEYVSEVRDTIEAMGFQTSSVVDTVESVGEFFGNLRFALLVLGLIALGVASLGMFNTLTVSLLEKTREVGLLKTMGLKSTEVRTLFLAESMIMSVMGGVVGLLIGFGVGKIISIVISIIAISQGREILDVTYIPAMLSVALVVVSSIVGILTGWYPAQRAKTISALNALRYE